MSVPGARTERDLCSHQAQQMCLGRGALDGKVWCQIHIYVRQLLKAVTGCPKSRVLAVEHHQVVYHQVSPELDAGQFAVLILMTVNKNRVHGMV